jgi:hypothetical protein
MGHLRSQYFWKLGPFGRNFVLFQGVKKIKEVGYERK